MCKHISCMLQEMGTHKHWNKHERKHEHDTATHQNHLSRIERRKTLSGSLVDALLQVAYDDLQSDHVLTLGFVF